MPRSSAINGPPPESELPALLVSTAAPFTTKQDFAAALLREAIVTGRLAPGTRLRQEDVARQLHLSWTPVREAFRLLEAEGWLQVGRHRGAVVAPLTVQDFEEIYLLRLTNEPDAARLSAAQMGDPSLAAMRQLTEQMSRLDLDQVSAWHQFLRLERNFHDLQYRHVGRRRLYEVVMSLRDAAERYLHVSFTIADEPWHHSQVHTELLAACEQRDGERAAQAIRGALERVLARTRPLLPDSPDTLTRDRQPPDARPAAGTAPDRYTP